MSMTVREFCDNHCACGEMRSWLLATDAPGMCALWKRDDMLPVCRIWIATRPGVLGDRELRLFACWCCRQVWHLITDERCRRAVEVAELYAEGRVSSDALAAAALAAYTAVEGAMNLNNTGWTVAWVDARYAAENLVWVMATALARDVTSNIPAFDSGAEAAYRVAFDDAIGAQAAYLAEHVHPIF